MARPAPAAHPNESGGSLRYWIEKAHCTIGRRRVMMINMSVALPYLMRRTVKTLKRRLKTMYSAMGSHAPSQVVARRDGRVGDVVRSAVRRLDDVVGREGTSRHQ